MSPADLLVDALAAHRIVRLVQRDTITARWRDAALSKLYPDHHPLVELLTCPHCLSVHVALGVGAARSVAPRWWGWLARALAISAAAGMLAEHEG